MPLPLSPEAPAVEQALPTTAPATATQPPVQEQPTAEPAPEPAPEPEPIPEPEPEAVPEPAPEPESAPELEPLREPEPATVQQTAAVPEPVPVPAPPQPAANPQPTLTSDADDKAPPPAGGGRSPGIFIGILIGVVLLAAGAAFWAYRSMQADAPPRAATAPASANGQDAAQAAAETDASAAAEGTAPAAEEDAADAAGESADSESADDASTKSAAAQPLQPRPTRELWRTTCASCHDRGEGKSPRVSQPGEWDGLLVRSRAAMVRSVLDGHGGSPAGAGADLSEEEARRLVAQVVQQVERAASAAEAERARRAAAEREAASKPAESRPQASGGEDWLTALRRELDACSKLSFFAQIPCREKARWQYCNNRWDTVPECATNNQRNN